MLTDEAQADEAAPVLADQGDVAEVEPVEQELAHPLDVAGERVVAAFGGLVGAAEADQVRGHDLQPGAGQDRDHLAVEVRPGRLAVHEQHHRGGGVSLAQVVHPEGAAVAIGDLRVVGLEVEAGQAGEACIGGAEGQHAGGSLRGHAPQPPRRRGWCGDASQT